jgi:hypothetical protein
MSNTYIGDPTKHHRYSIFKSGSFSDYKLVLNDKSFTVHKVILFSKSVYFQTIFSSTWKESNNDTLSLPDGQCSNEALHVFLLFLYTSRIQQQMLDQYLFELLDLSDYFQVEILKSITMERVKKGLSAATAEAYLNRIRTHNEPELITMLIDFVTFNYPQLARNEFPFHKLGKKMLLEVLRRIRNPGYFKKPRSVRNEIFL